jgi:hypothetical protein
VGLGSALTVSGIALRTASRFKLRRQLELRLARDAPNYSQGGDREERLCNKARMPRRLCGPIVMASHGRRGVAAVVLGSESTKVLAHCSIPVLVHRASQLSATQMLTALS